MELINDGIPLGTPIDKQNIVTDDFYNEYHSQIRAIVARILQYPNQMQEIDDCINTVFLELMKKSDLYDSDRGDIGAFVAVVARTVALNYRKKNIRNNYELVGDDKFDYLFIPIVHNDKIEFELLVKDIVSRLNKQEAALFAMRYLYYYSNVEIGEALGIKQGAVEMRVTRLRRKIKRYLLKGGIIL